MQRTNEFFPHSEIIDPNRGAGSLAPERGGKCKSFFRIIPFSCVSDGAVFAALSLLGTGHDDEDLVVLLSKKMNQKSDAGEGGPEVR